MNKNKIIGLIIGAVVCLLTVIQANAEVLSVTAPTPFILTQKLSVESSGNDVLLL